MNMNKTLSLVAGIALTTFGLQVHAAGWTECNGNKITWDSNSVKLKAGVKSFVAGGAYAQALQTSIDRVNANPSKFRFSLSLGDSSLGVDNGENEVWFTTDSELLNGAPARTLKWMHCYDFFGLHYGIDETDIVFDANEKYTTSTNKADLWTFGGNWRPFHTTAIHEIGHAMGLAHENRWYNIMGEDWTHIHVNGSTTRAYFGEDASEGSVLLYGTNSGTIEDLSLTNEKYLGTSGQYSTHQFTQLFNSADAVLSSFMDAGENRYFVNKGQLVKFEYTAENNGKSQKTAKVAFYISTNSTISTGDKLIGTGTLTLTRNKTATVKTSLYIPNDLIAGGNYWVGAIIDYDNQLPETVENNNATYLPIRVN